MPFCPPHAGRFCRDCVPVHGVGPDGLCVWTGSVWDHSEGQMGSFGAPRAPGVGVRAFKKRVSWVDRASFCSCLGAGEAECPLAAPFHGPDSSSRLKAQAAPAHLPGGLVRFISFEGFALRGPTLASADSAGRDAGHNQLVSQGLAGAHGHGCNFPTRAAKEGSSL